MEFLKDLFWGLMLFNIVSNVLGTNVRLGQIEFAGDTISEVIRNREEIRVSYRKKTCDLEAGNRNRMKFNSTNCKVKHMGINYKNCYKLGAHQLEATEEEENLSVLVDLSITKNTSVMLP